MGTATTKDICSIKARINQLIMTQSLQQETLVHITSILNVTQYAAQVNRHSINILMDKVDETSHDISSLYNLTTSLATSISFHQLILHIRSVFANLCNSLNYIRTVSTHTMDYIIICHSYIVLMEFCTILVLLPSTALYKVVRYCCVGILFVVLF